MYSVPEILDVTGNEAEIKIQASRKSSHLLYFPSTWDIDGADESLGDPDELKSPDQFST